MTEAMTLRAREDLMASVAEIETVTGDFLTEPGPPFWRIEIDGCCADFDFPEAARNFRDAINARIAAARAALAAMPMGEEALREENARLREALKPFAEGGTNAEISGYPPSHFVDANAYIRARAALSHGEKG